MLARRAITASVTAWFDSLAPLDKGAGVVCNSMTAFVERGFFLSFEVCSSAPVTVAEEVTVDSCRFPL